MRPQAGVAPPVDRSDSRRSWPLAPRAMESGGAGRHRREDHDEHAGAGRGRAAVGACRAGFGAGGGAGARGPRGTGVHRGAAPRSLRGSRAPGWCPGPPPGTSTRTTWRRRSRRRPGPDARRWWRWCGRGFIGTAPGQVQDLQAELAREPADVLLADSMSFGGMLTGELTGMPWATGQRAAVQPGADGPPMGLPVTPWPGPWDASGTGVALGRSTGSPPARSSGPTSGLRRRWACRASGARTGRDLMSPWLVLATGCPGLGDPRAT